MLCAYTRPRYQVNVYRTIGPVVKISYIVYKISDIIIKISYIKY